jgi:serine protease AprX
MAQRTAGAGADDCPGTDVQDDGSEAEMTERSVRWGRGGRALAAMAVGLVAVPTVLSTAAVAGPAPLKLLKLPKAVKGEITVMQDLWGDKSTDKVSRSSDGVYRAEQDPGSLFTVTKAIGARSVWSQKDAAGRAVTGQGVTVALLDSGLSPVPGLDGAGKVVQGPDLSLENGSDALRNLDSFGHGTHLAGIIAGEDVVDRDAKTGEPKGTKPADQLGVAPDAGLLALKLATANGSTDVSQVIAALDWVSQHKNDHGMNVRVVNLAFGTDSLQPYQLDPLAAAAENAWRNGLVVVVSGGNDGQRTFRLTDPAMDPYVIAVGASDPVLRVDGWKTPRVADFSNSGTSQRHVDLLAPGKSMTALRDPGSFVDVEHPEGRLRGDTSGRLFRGSGTSQASAVVSGAAALLLQANPALTPDQVKAALVATAKPVPGVSPVYQGAGQLDVDAAVALSRSAVGKTGAAATALLSGALQALPGALPLVGPASAALPGVVQRFPVATGTGSLEAARGGSNLFDPESEVVLAGEVDVQGLPFDAARWAASSAKATAWSGGSWTGALVVRGLVGGPLVGRALVGGPLVRRPVEQRPLGRGPLVRGAVERRELGRRPLVRRPVEC